MEEIKKDRILVLVCYAVNWVVVVGGVVNVKNNRVYALTLFIIALLFALFMLEYIRRCAKKYGEEWDHLRIKIKWRGWHKK